MVSVCLLQSFVIQFRISDRFLEHITQTVNGCRKPLDLGCRSAGFSDDISDRQALTALRSKSYPEVFRFQSRDCLARGLKKHVSNASYMPGIFRNALIARKARISTAINTNYLSNSSALGVIEFPNFVIPH
ncbi:MAG: hypothetical protein U1F35_01895 [Steroidobacteraceae bacterium]